MGKIKGWIQDRKESNHLTFWASGFGLRRGYVDIQKSNKEWKVDIYKNQGHYEDAKQLPVKTFDRKTQAIKFARSYMKKHPNG